MRRCIIWLCGKHVQVRQTTANQGGIWVVRVFCRVACDTLLCYIFVTSDRREEGVRTPVFGSDPVEEVEVQMLLILFA